MNKDKIISMIHSLLSFIIIILIVIFAIYAVEKKVNEAYKLGYEYSRVNTENQMFDDFLDIYEGYYELYADYKVLEERLEWLSPDAVVHKFDKNYNFYLLLIVSRTKVNDDIWLYGLQEVGNNHETIYVESDELFSVSEQVIAVETSENNIILIDIS